MNQIHYNDFNELINTGLLKKKKTTKLRIDDLDKYEISIKDETIEILIYYFFLTAVIECSIIESKKGFTKYTLIKYSFDEITDHYNRIKKLDIGILELNFSIK